LQTASLPLAKVKTKKIGGRTVRRRKRWTPLVEACANRQGNPADHASEKKQKRLCSKPLPKGSRKHERRDSGKYLKKKPVGTKSPMFPRTAKKSTEKTWVGKSRPPKRESEGGKGPLRGKGTRIEATERTRTRKLQHGVKIIEMWNRCTGIGKTLNATKKMVAPPRKTLSGETSGNFVGRDKWTWCKGERQKGRKG